MEIIKDNMDPYKEGENVMDPCDEDRELYSFDEGSKSSILNLTRSCSGVII